MRRKASIGLAVAALIAGTSLVAYLVSRPGADAGQRDGAHGNASELPASPLSAIAAANMARGHAAPTASLRSIVAGPFQSVFARLGTSGDPLTDAPAPTDLVWVATFTDQFEICPPDGSPCWSPRPGTTEVVLDYASGSFLFSSSSAPAPP